MDLPRAISFSFDDGEWFSKLAMVALLHAATIFLMPFFFFGLLPLCMLLGYSVELVEKVHNAETKPLPQWKDYGGYISRGANMLPALFLYNLPFIIAGCCIITVQTSIADIVIEGFALLIMLCCLVPLSVAYSAFTWPMLAVATTKYAHGSPAKVYFEFGKLSDAVNAMGNTSIQYFLIVVLVNLSMLVIQILPFIGQIITFMLYFPIMSHLIGQYGRILDKKDPHRKRR